MSDYDSLGNAGRDRDRSRRQEAELPPDGGQAPRHPSPTPADLDRFAGQPTPSAASVRRRRDTYCK